MKIATRLLLTFLGVFIAFLGIGGWSVLQIRSLNNEVGFAYQEVMPSLEALKDMQTGVQVLRANLLTHILETDAGKKKGYEKVIADNRLLLDRNLQKYQQQMAANEALKASATSLQTAYTAFSDSFNKALAKSTAGFFDAAAMIATGDTQQKVDMLLSLLNKQLNDKKAIATQQSQTTEKNSQLAMKLTLVLLGVIMVVIGLASLRVYRILQAGLQTIQQTITHISQSLDFTYRAKAGGKTEVDQTIVLLNTFLDRVQTNLRTILEGSRQVSEAAGELLTTANQVAELTSTQNEATTNVAATVEEMSVSITQVSNQSGDMLQMAENAGELAKSGSVTIANTVSDIKGIAQTVGRTSLAINELDGQSAKINSIVSVIREVAEQTNLLALNAAIEAARAGEQGRGFAVVADEVRRLAERTSTATQEIAETINAMRNCSLAASQQTKQTDQIVTSGVARADDADKAILQIGESALETVTKVNEMFTALREQTAASTNIAEQVEIIAQMTDQASAAAHRTTSLANNLTTLANRQIDILDQYRLG
ncbi:methyl-accepting chemotaxis protein [Leeia sp. TBRC 13508]|uniref:Methyl-accepting chemotaxis protein n=1 Tax=Leeia speluncae TaxID=2884804 RepID=A0ABS8D1L6_9NEIS|nr:methyl-accepting chemotaxis protein [Leeia speluncae]MCB6182092.1 methyl-accepting chemotaxis protein [Leeia speluncae]